MMGLALFDVDGTLFANPSSESRFILRLLRQGRLGSMQLSASLWFYLRWLPRYGLHVPRKNKAYLTGLAIDQVQRDAERFVAEELMPLLRPQLLERIRWHQEQGDAVALLTGTPDFIARPLAHRLNITHWSAAQSTCRNGRYTAAPPEEHPYGVDKLFFARRLCHTLGHPLENTAAYADSRQDLPLLEAVGRAVAVDPDPVLANHALQRRWEVIDTSLAPSPTAQFSGGARR